MRRPAVRFAARGRIVFVVCATTTSGFLIEPHASFAADVPAVALPQDPAVLNAPVSRVGVRTHALGGFGININAGATLAGNGPALAAFDRAADRWEAFIADPIPINIQADLAPLGGNTIGSAGSVILQGGYNTVRNQMAADALDEGPDDAIVQALPTAEAFRALLPAGRALSGQVSGSKANFKALGFTGLDERFGATDGQITFNSTFNFDFDRSDGISPGATDFETVAVHEIGHVLGFFSAVDDIIEGQTAVSPVTLDLFRFANDVVGSDPATAGDFAVGARSLRPGADEIFDDTLDEDGLSTGVSNAAFPDLDGNQASHWKADEITGELIGVMDPTLAAGQVYPITASDLRAFDLIGYEIVSVVPEPALLPLTGALVILLGRRRRVGRAGGGAA